MATVDWRRFQGPAIGFAVALVPLIWTLHSVMGRSLSPVELPFILVGLAVIVFAFTCALAPGTEPRRPSDAERHSDESRAIGEFFVQTGERPSRGIDHDSSTSSVGMSPNSAPNSQPAACAGTDPMRRSVSQPSGTARAKNRTQDGLLWRGNIEELLASVQSHTYSPAGSDTARASGVPIPLSRHVNFGTGGKTENSSGRDAGERVAQSQPRGRATMRWYGRHEALQVGGFLLEVPMVYASDGPAGVEEPSCIDLRLEIGRPTRTNMTAGWEFVPYAAMAVDQRSNYLNWLANGRPPRLSSFADRLLFLCGLERRLLIDHRDHEEIVTEVVRLLRVCDRSDPLAWNLSRFASFVLSTPELASVNDGVVARYSKRHRTIFGRTFSQLLWRDT